MSVENLTEFEWHMKYFQFLKKLEKAGANLDIFLNGELEESIMLKFPTIFTLTHLGLSLYSTKQGS